MQSTTLAILPSIPVTIRVATTADLPFMDSLQKAHSKQLGYFPTKQFEDYIAGGHVLIAEETERVGGRGGVGGGLDPDPTHPHPHTHTLLGYCISKDRYLKRDELGVVYQLCVAPGVQRKLVGASLIRAAFERSAYGCRLYCCWCAQDIAANWFWESMGFIPVAFRAGSDKKKRVHIFWQRRIDAEDQTTPYWYPSQTNAGAIREDRLVFPIPPGTHWSDVKAVELPRERTEELGLRTESKGTGCARPCGKRTTQSSAPSPQYCVSSGGLRFATAEAKPAKAPRVRAAKPKVKNDPKHVAAARELRDRYLEHVNDRLMLAASAGKYDVSRAIDAGARPTPLLKAC